MKRVISTFASVIFVSSLLNAQVSQYNNDSIQNLPPIRNLIPNIHLSLKDWTNNYLKSLKGTPTGNLRLIGDRGDYFDNISSSWIYNDSTAYTYEASFGNKDLELFKMYDNVTSSWVNSYRYQNSYNGNGWLSQKIGEAWDGTSWVNDDRDTYTYNSNGQITEKIDFNWSSGNWVNNRRYLYSYDANNNNDVYTVFKWNNVTSNWEPDNRYLYQYDSNDNITQYIYQDWVSGNWENYDKQNSYYNSNNQYFYSLSYTWNNVSNTWKNSYKDTIIFTSPTIRENIGYTWNTTLSAWEYYIKYNQTYTPSGIILSNVTTLWDPTNTYWGNYNRYSYTLDSQENYSTYLYEFWNDAISEWVNFSSSIMNFNNDNYQTYYLDKMWNNSSSSWVNNNRRYFRYEANPFASIADNGVQYQLNVYPNPSTNFVALKMNLPQAEDVLVTIYNLSGQQVYQKNYPNAVGNVTYFIDLNNLSNGTYVIQVQTENEIMNRKLVKQ